MLKNIVPFSVILSAALLISAGANAKPSKAATAKASSCFACHGESGMSSNPMYPSLAGRSKAYLTKQINAFKKGDRKDPVMTPMANILSDADVALVAEYYAAQKVVKTGSRKGSKSMGSAETPLR